MKKSIKQIYEMRKEYLKGHHSYTMMPFYAFDYSILDNIVYYKKRGRGKNHSYNDVWIMFDTETSKKFDSQDNHICAWSIAIRAFDMNIVTLYGGYPSDLINTLEKIHKSMNGERTIFWAHNLSYDWWFVRKFCFDIWGYPVEQLNIKSHYPINIVFNNGIVFRDSLIIAQRGIEKWGVDLGAEHQKAVGAWDYGKLRNQSDIWFLSSDEKRYIECDVVCGVECLNITANSINKNVASMPFTATGIAREEVRKRGKVNRAREEFEKQAPTIEQYKILEEIYHGGYTHCNRHIADYTIYAKDELIRAYDFASSYPFCMLAYKYPSSRFTPIDDCDIDYIVRNRDKYAFIFKLRLYKVRLKNNNIAMPSLQYSKMITAINPIKDNGRLLYVDYCEFYTNSIDLEVLLKQYDFDGHLCSEVQVSTLDYLPKWYRDFVFESFVEKTKKKGQGVAYQLAKARLNSLYGLLCMKWIKPSINEQYDLGAYVTDCTKSDDDLFNKYVRKENTILNFAHGLFVTSYAYRNLFRLMDCIADDGLILYCDTDSCYATRWDESKVNAYNEECKRLIKQSGYTSVEFNGREYWLGVAEVDGEYKKFRGIHSKCYCVEKSDGELKITVAGVPKKTGAKCLKSIDEFTDGFIFRGSVTGKLTHKYICTDSIYYDINGNQTGDSIDLYECDYLISHESYNNFEIDDEVSVFYYE